MHKLFIGIIAALLINGSSAFAQSIPQNAAICDSPPESADGIAAHIAACTALIESKAVFDFNRSRYLSNRGTSYANQEQNSLALADFDAALRLDANYAQAYANRGALRSTLGEAAGAMADFDRVLQIVPTDAQTLRNRGLAHVRANKYGLAIVDFSSLIRAHPDNVEGHLNRGKVYAMTGNAKAAIADLTAAIKIAPDRAEAYGDRATAYAISKNYPAAIADYTAALQLDDTEAGLWANRGLAHYRSGDPDQAIPDFEQALARNERHASALKGLGDAHFAKSAYEPALAAFDRLAALNPPAAARTRGMLRFIVGRYEDASEDLAVAAKADPSDAYGPLIDYLARRRAGAAGTLTNLSPRVDLQKWPGPVIRLFRGEASAADVRAAAQLGDPDDKDGQNCEAAFYLGEQALFGADVAAARALLQQAADSCPVGFYERDMARMELTRLPR